MFPACIRITEIARDTSDDSLSENVGEKGTAHSVADVSTLLRPVPQNYFDSR